MKENKKIRKSTQVIETKKSNPGSVGEFITLLEQLPEDSEFTLNGNINIKGVNVNGEIGNLTIYPRESTCNDYDSKNCTNNECDHIICSDKCTCAAVTNSGVNTDKLSSIANDIIKDYHTGIAYDNPSMLNEIREMTTESLINAPIMTPNKGELFHECHLDNGQLLMINDIREHNRYVAECFGELFRRGTAALLEYNTQCLARFGVESNKTMCYIAQSPIAKDDEIDYGCFDGDEV